MGCCFGKRCIKCGCPVEYYQNRDPGNSCRECVYTNNGSGNYYHKWEYICYYV